MRTFMLFIAFCFCTKAALAQLQPQERAELDSLILLILEKAPALSELDLKIEQQQYQLRVEKSSWFSGMDIGLQFFSMEQQTVTSGEQASSYYSGAFLPQVGGSLRINLYKLLTTPQRIKIVKKDIERSEAFRQQTSETLVRWMTLKYFEYALAKRQAASLFLLLESQKQQEQLIRKRFEKSEASFDALLKVQNAVIQSETAWMKQNMNVERFREEIDIAIR